MQICFWKTLTPFRKANYNCKSLGQKISSHGLYFRRLKDLHSLWIKQGNSTALMQYNKEWVVLISVEHKKPAICAYMLERSFTTNHRNLRWPIESYPLCIHSSLHTLHSLEKCFSCLSVLHTAQRYKYERQDEVRHNSANIKMSGRNLETSDQQSS